MARWATWLVYKLNLFSLLISIGFSFDGDECFFYSLVSTLMVQMTTSCPLSLEMSVLRAHSIDSASHSFHLPLFMLTLLVSILQILQITSLFQAFSKPNKAH